MQRVAVAVERGAGACRGHGQEPVSVSRLRALLSSANLPIYFSSGIGYKWARPEATTALPVSITMIILDQIPREQRPRLGVR